MKTYTITIDTWVNGTPTTACTVNRDFSTDDAALNYAQYLAQDYNVDYVIYVHENSREVGHVTIYSDGRHIIVKAY